MKIKHLILPKTILLSFMLSTIFTQAFAQNAELEGLVDDTKNDLLVVIAGGLGGAVLGLSTLSFVEEPKDHTRNIVVGASLGIIAGVGYVALSQATRSREMIYGNEGEEASHKFNTKERRVWHGENENFEPIVSPYSVAVSFRY